MTNSVLTAVCCRALAFAIAGAGLFVAMATPASAVTADEIITKARAFLGADAALDGVESIRFSGSILMENGTSGDIEIIVRRPMQQRVVIAIENAREVTALSGYDAWRRLESVTNPAQWELTILEAKQIQRMRANTIEHLGFFKGVGLNTARVTLVAEESIDGAPVATLAFEHSGGVRFLRSFNMETGQLVRTGLENGSTLTEAGEMTVDGVRFPKELITKSAQGTSTVLFTRIQLNEPFPDEMFDVPSLMPGGYRVSE